MLKLRAGLAGGLAFLLSSCATTSFAPPTVNLNAKTTIGVQKAGTCISQIQTGAADSITGDVEGARALINNYIYIYRCRAHSAANGRQLFEVPALLTAAGGTLAAALGAGPNVAIGTGGAGAIFSRGQNYYDPKTKAAIYDHALDALLCIKTEAVGVQSFNTTSGVQNFALDGDNGGLTVSVKHQYFDMVSAALFSVERILAQRLSASGTFDPAGLIAEIEAVKKKVDDAEAEKKAKSNPDPAPAPVPTATPTPPTTPAPAALSLTIPAIVAALNSPHPSGGEEASLDLGVLGPKLQQCILRAKL